MMGNKGDLCWAARCYGVDLQDDGINVVRAERSRSGVKCTTVAETDPVFRHDISDGVPVVGCLQVRQSFAKWVEAPLASASKARRVLPTVLDIQLPFALEDCVYGFVAESKEAGKVRALAVGGRAEDVDRRIEQYVAEKCDPHVLDQAGVALWTQGLVESPLQDGEDLRVIVCAGDQQSTLVVGRHGCFLGAHAIRSGDMGQVARLLRAAAKREGRDDTEHVRWLWAGGGAEDRDGVASLMNEVSDVWGGEFEVVNEPGSFLARAIASRALTSGDLRWNFRTGQRIHHGIADRSWRQSVQAAAVILAAGIVLCAGSFGVGAMMSNVAARLKSEFGSRVDDVAGYHVTARGEDALSSVDRKVKSRMAELAPFLNATDPSVLSYVRTIILAAGKDGLICRTMAVRRGHIMVRGLAPNWNGCAGLKKQVAASGLIVKLDRSEVLVEERVPFTLIAGRDDE